MNKLVSDELDIYLEKIEKNSIKESWVRDNLKNLYNYIINRDGNTLSEKIYLLTNELKKCKICNNDVKFLSYKRGYREYCSKKCSNNDELLLKLKLESYKKTSVYKYGVDNPSKSEIVKSKLVESKKNIDYESMNNKARISSLERWGVDNPSKSEEIKEKKKKTTQMNWGVDNPFQSEEIKEKIRDTNIKKYGFYHQNISEEIKEKIRNTNIKKYRSENFKSSEIDKIGTEIAKDINYIKYLSKSTYLFKCNDKPHNFKILYDNYYHRKKSNLKICTVCNPISELSSIKEKELFEFISSIYLGVIKRNYKIEGNELDIYLPELNLGFEFNGVYWHSNKFRDNRYHLNKTNFFKKGGIRVIHIWEDDWLLRNEILKSQIRNWLGLSTNKVFARKCQVLEITDSKIVTNFLNDNHIQGTVRSNLKLGLFLGEEMVSLMTFDHLEGRKKMGLVNWNINRFCNKSGYSIIGGASKLFNHFIKNYNVNRVISYADKDWSVGDLYLKLGFKKVNESKPDYKYVVGMNRIHKSRFRKSKTGISESKLDINKIWDCGKIKFEMII
jgi:hypothetical protein